MAVLDYLPKLKRDLGLAFDAYFRYDFTGRKRRKDKNTKT